MSLVRPSVHNAPEVPLEQTSFTPHLLPASLQPLLAPVSEHFEAMTHLLHHALRADISTADAVSRYVARTKGKGIRPALVLLSAEATGEVTPHVRSAAVGIELIQASTLLHDDVIDDSRVRRGAPSVNARWGNDIAVLMGDVLFAQAVSLFVETESLPLMRTAARQARIMIEGEVFARELRRTPDFQESTYLDLIRRKTGALMALATQAGPILTDASEATTRHLFAYGEALGMAFQIADDILDVVGDASVVGKPTGQDLREGTVTLPLIRALANAPDGDGRRIQDMVRHGISTDEQWETVRQFITMHRGVDSARDLARRFSLRARAELANLPDSPARTSLEGMLDYVITRST